MLKMERAGASLELNRIPEELETLPETLKRGGYATFGIADNPNVGVELGFAQGFDELKTYARYRSAEGVNDQLARWQTRLADARRYFLYLHYFDPHAPYQPRAPWFEEPDDPQERDRAAYDSEIRYTDAQLEQAFARHGWAHNALVVVTADHGEEFGDHGSVGHGRTLFTESIRVPLLMRFPDGRYAGRRVREAVSHLDLLPTLRELTGIQADPRNEGRSLLALLGGRRAGWEQRVLFGHLSRRDHRLQRVTRTAMQGAWKYVVVDPPGERMLFNLDEDPREQHNRIEQAPEIARSLEQGLLHFEQHSRKYAGGTAQVPLDEQAQENLRALGYVQ